MFVPLHRGGTNEIDNLQTLDARSVPHSRNHEMRDTRSPAAGSGGN